MDHTEDQRKRQASRSRTPFTELNQVSSDFAMAMALQEQERTLTVLTTIESESSEEEEESEPASDHELFNYNSSYDFFESHEFDSLGADLELLEGQGSNSDDDDEMDEDDDGIDVDELTYEELIALGEFIGEEKRGLTLNEISTCLHACKGWSVEKTSGIDRCVICQNEYEEGEALVALACEHPYHSECISNWLQVKKLCPICSTEVSPNKNNISKI
ncbi:E3 ubiquitin ligase BIG BROTHER-related [Melia azedarach]|uniref:E3 ubiquitin ligase BIG BROTHER-related n=1 Tax=Melia azedarach TaxID=155640 RepID=A0ACC1WNT9_MELAZ|nr:E3 ubiquitin ligase BIG BROTHER-related [Melia azedarach]